MTSILQKVLDIPSVLSHFLEVDNKGRFYKNCIDNFSVCTCSNELKHSLIYLMFETDITNCKILGQEQNGEFILCWNFRDLEGSCTAVGLFFYTIKKIQVNIN